MTENRFARLSTLVDELVKVAHLLVEGSKHDISFLELKQLQEKQSSILKEIEMIQRDGSQGSLEARQQIKMKLTQFEAYNSEFIQNVKRQKGIIHLEGKSQED
mgnify:CR=1 FL=1